MRIDPKLQPAALGAAAASRRSDGARRFSLDERGPERPGAAGASAPLATIDALLARQGEGDRNERRRRTLQRGHDLLDGLDRLKAALLSGSVPTADLKAVAGRLAARREATGDPRLDELLAHIELRAEVELAKLGMAQTHG
jgi:hypothetical protein